MREQFTLAHSTNELLTGEIRIGQFLQRLFGDRTCPHYEVFTRALEAYHNKDGGSPVVTRLELIDAKFDPQTRAGSFRVRFALHFHYTCSDVHNDAKDTISWEFHVDEQAGTIHFIGEEPWVRDVE